MSNPFLFLAPLNGSLAYQSRAGGGTLTGSGAVRYRAAENARVNLMKNPHAVSSSAAGSTWVATTGGSCAPTSSTVLGATAHRITASTSANSGVIFWHGAAYTGGVFAIESKVAHTFSADVALVSGTANWQVCFYELDAAGGVLGAALGGVSITPVAGGSRVLVTYTPTATGVDAIAPCFRHLDASAAVIDVRAMTLVTGTLTDLPHFDGANNGGVWLDPRTGILGTAHASPSVSQAVAWIEEATTNTVPDPSFEAATITTNWTAQGSAAISKVTTHAYLGANGGKVVCSASTSDGIHQLATSGAAASNGQSWTLSGRIRAFAAADIGDVVKPAIIERTSADAVVATNLGSSITLTDAWQEFTYTVTLAGGGTVAKVTMGMMNGAAVACDWVIDDLQLEQKAYATSPCNGAIGTGYGWSGTAHASSSTRTATAVLLPESVDLVMPAASGSVFARFSRTIDNGGTCEIFNFGDYNSANKDCLQLYVSSGDALTASWRYGTVSQVTPGVAGALAVGTWYVAGVTWSGANMDLWRGTTQATPITNRLYYGDTDSALNNIGIGCTPGGSSALDGGVGPVAIFSRPLTARERAILNGKKAWHWNLLRDAA